MKVVHKSRPGVYPSVPMAIEVRECATLGTLFADVYIDGELFIQELDREVAERFANNPSLYSMAFSEVPKIRLWLLEYFYRKVLV